MRSSPARPARAAALLLGVWLIGCGSAPPPAVERVVLVTVDTLRADRLGCYGAERAHTPTMDTLAASGVRFQTAISPVPLTLPAHASLMTALDPPQHGVRHNSIHRLSGELPVLAEALRGAGFRTAAFVGAVVLDRRFGLARGFDVYDDDAGRASSAPTIGYGERPADAVVDAALAWLESAPPRFFLWLHFYDPHARYAPPPGFAAAFAHDRYAGEIAFVDRELSRLLAGIDERFGPGGRLVVLTSDHGESLGEHGEQTHAYGIYDATQRIPLIWAGPGLPAGRVVETPVRLIDVAPTLLAAVGAPPLAGASGRDLAPLLAGDREAADEPAYLETLATQLDYGWSPLLGLRTREWKYVRAPRPELYDLAADPGELRDLSAQRPELVQRLDAELEARLARGGAESARAEPSGSQRAALRSLGYVVPADGDAAQPLVLRDGPDPKDEIGLLRTVAEAEALADRGRPAEGLALLDPLVDPPTHVRILRAALRQGAGRPALAAEDARLALAAEPERVDARLILAAALESEGELDPARAAFEEALAREPRSLPAWRGVLRIAERTDDDAGAARARAQLEALSGAEARADAAETRDARTR